MTTIAQFLGRRPRIVIADDSPTIRTLLRHFLEGECDVVGEAANGHEALHLAEELAPDLIFMDLMMPAMGGLEAIRQIRERAPGARVIVASVQDDWETLRKCMSLGARDFLTKPFSQPKVLEALQRVFAQEIEQARAEVKARRTGAGSWAFLAPGTGDGRTTLLVGLAESLRRQGASVLVVDLNLMFGDIDLYLDVPRGQPGLHQLLQKEAVLEPETFERFVSKLPGGLHVLLPGVKAEDVYGFPWEAVPELVEALERHYDYVLLDLPAGLPDTVLPILDRARYVFPVGSIGPETLKNLRHLTDLMLEVGYPQDKLRPLVVSPQDVVEVTWLKRFTIPGARTFPHDAAPVREALHRGVPVTALETRGHLATTIDRFAAELTGTYSWVPGDRPISSPGSVAATA